MTKVTVMADAKRAVAKVGVTFGEELMKRFIDFADVSESSRKTYQKGIRHFLSYLRGQGISKPARQDIRAWLAGMKEEKKSASTIQLYLTATKIFFRWLAQENIYSNVADNVKAGVRVSRSHKKDALSTDQCAKLVRSVGGDSEKALRDRAILSLMVTSGLRTVEVVRADVGDIRFERGKVFLYVQGKGHYSADEKVLLSKQTLLHIQGYLKARGKAQPQEPLFVSTSRRNKNARLDTQTVRKMVKCNLRGIGLDTPRLTAHSLRHSTATNLICSGVSLPEVQMILRHKNLNTTMIYADAWQRYQNDGEQTLADEIFGQEKEVAENVGI